MVQPNPARVLVDVVQGASSSLVGRRLDVPVKGHRVDAMIKSVRPVVAVLPSLADRATEVSDRLLGSARRNLLDPIGFGLELFDTAAQQLDRTVDAFRSAVERGPSLPVLDRIDFELADLHVDGVAVSELSLGVESVSVDAELDARSGFVARTGPISLRATLRLVDLAPWLAQLGKGDWQATLHDDGSVGLSPARFARYGELVGRVTVERDVVVLTIDRLRVFGRSIPLPRSQHRTQRFDPKRLHPTLTVRSVTIGEGQVRVDGNLPSWTEPLELRQLEELSRRAAAKLPQFALPRV